MVEIALIALLVVSWLTAYVIGVFIGRLRTQADYVQRDMQRLVDQAERLVQPAHHDGTSEREEDGL